MKTYLVTGGAGFIGSHIATHLIQQGHQVVILDNLSTGREENIPEGAQFIKMDLADLKQYRLLKDISAEAVFHLAGQSSGEISFADPWYDFQSHVVSTFHLLTYCREKNIKRFLYASSMSVYGDPETLPVKEEDPLQPKSFYGTGKSSAENYIRFFQGLGVETTILRFFNVYGPGQNLDNMRQGMASIYLAFMLKGQPIQVKGSKDRFRDFLYIDDLVSGWMKAYQAEAAFGKTYNLCSGVKTTVEDLIELLKTAYGDPDYPTEYLKGTPGDQFGLYGDNSVIINELGWSPQTSLERGLSAMVEHAKKGVSVG
ncbi:MAG: NAD-dependent epimerase/dehydratase family protein [Candidatus Omnitrophica bacterium]|nr:NAD-dependent epimerase/dehydratase family protein [Candidatus Omnitrophota bacterium]